MEQIETIRDKALEALQAESEMAGAQLPSGGP